jgi:hypothetical protein
MSMAEYAVFRNKVLKLNAPSFTFDGSYRYYRDLWIETGEIEYLERMVAKIDE